MKLGDKVIVISGKDKGKIGKVTKVLPREAKVIVEGVNVCTKHTKLPTQREGEIKQIELPLWIWKIAIAVEKDGKTVPTRIKKDNGKRIAIKTGESID
ncbi:MAG: 50S ribosomal protein L24 [Candidatus Caenarcaniphilales bacterium]|nr:50S ribosomal protein L24 [Candidatus Caenarcaniphilales bacterium]